MRKLWTLLLPAVFAFALLGCSSDDTTDPTNLTEAEQFAAVHDALIDYVSTSAPAVKGLDAALYTDITEGDYTILDFRSTTDYDLGHIAGAYDVSLGNLLDQLNGRALPTDKPFLAVCYSGQSAGHGVIALRALGYEAYSLKFGMSAWHEDRDSWTSNCASGAPFVTTASPALDDYDYPSWDENVTTEAGAVEARVVAMLDGGFKGISYADLVTAGPENYFIINYFGETDYIGDGGTPGHLDGAYQFTPGASLGMDEMLSNIPDDMPVVVYCWTGQTSSQMTAYLNLLGYEAYSLKFGSNGLWYDQMTSHKWSQPGNTYPLEGAALSSEEIFTASHDALIDYINTSAPAVKALDATLYLDITEGDYTVLDFRSTTDYDLGHIAGAIDVGLGDLLDKLDDSTIPTNKPFLAVCYTGQSAGHGVIALRALGYEAYSLKFGMSAWTDDLDKWTTNCASGAPFETTANTATTSYDWPTLDDAVYTIDEAVRARVEAMLDGGFKGKSYADLVIDGLDNYFIINYFGEADYNGTGGSGIPGHLEGAYQFTPAASMGMDEMLEYVPTDMPVIVYCWTGQTSSQMTAYLNLLGYEAYSLKFGSNGLWYDLLTGHKWTATGNDYPLE